MNTSSSNSTRRGGQDSGRPRPSPRTGPKVAAGDPAGALVRTTAGRRAARVRRRLTRPAEHRRLPGDDAQQLHMIFGTYDGPVRIRCTASRTWTRILRLYLSTWLRLNALRGSCSTFRCRKPERTMRASGTVSSRTDGDAFEVDLTNHDA